MSCLVAFAVGEKWVQFFAFYYLFVLFMTLLLVWIYKLVLEIVSSNSRNSIECLWV
jgi:hypothetical protein